jgi:hypothetical protein
LPVERNSSTARALTAPVIVRRNPNEGEGRAITSRADNGGASVIRTIDNGNREIPARNSGENGGPQIFNRPERRASTGDNHNGGFRPVERIERPTVTRPANEDRRTTIPDRNGNNNSGGSIFSDRNGNRNLGDNGNNSSTIFNAPRERRMPTERSEFPTRNHERSERNEAPRPIERREAPRMPERTESPRVPERIERSSPRDNIPSRAPERMERQAPSSRDSAPMSRPERSGGGDRIGAIPSRKNDN